MDNTTTDSSDSWVLDGIGEFAAQFLQLFVQSEKHVVKDSIVVDNQIVVPDLLRTLSLLFSRQTSIAVFAVTGTILTIMALPLFCILIRRCCFCPWKCIRTPETVGSDQPLSSPEGSPQAQRNQKLDKSRGKRIKLTTAIFASTAIVTLAAVGMLLCAIRLDALFVQVSDLADAAGKSVHEAVENLKFDVRNTLKVLSGVVKNRTEHYTQTYFLEWKHASIRLIVKQFSRGNVMMDEYYLFFKESQQMLETVSHFITELVPAEKAFRSLQKVLERLLSDTNLKTDEEVRRNFLKITNLPKPSFKSEADKLLKAVESRVEKIKYYIDTVRSSLKNISLSVKNLERFSVLKEKFSEFEIPVAEAGKKSFGILERKFEQFSRSVDTLLYNKTATNLRLWEEGQTKTLSAVDGRVLSPVLLSIAIAGFVIAITTGTGMVIGTASTECFNNCSPTEYAISVTSSTGGSLVAAGTYATSLVLWLMFVILFVSSAVGVYHVDSCSSFGDYSILDFQLGALLSFGDRGVINVNQTVKAVVMTCRDSSNLLEAVGHQDLLMVNLSYDDISSSGESSSEPIIPIDIPVLKQAQEGAAVLYGMSKTIQNMLREAVEETWLYRGKLLGILIWREENLDGRRYPILTDNSEIWDGLSKLFYKYEVLASIATVSWLHEEPTRKMIIKVYAFLKKSVMLSEILEPFIGKSDDELLNAITRSYLHEMVEAMQSVLNGTGHLTCSTILREYERVKRFACDKLLIVLAATWLMCLLITLFLALLVAAGIPASRLFKPEALVLDQTSDQQRAGGREQTAIDQEKT